MGDLDGTKRSLLALAVVAAALPQISYAEKTGACIKTPPSGEILGKPFPRSENWYGSEALAVILPPDGIWRGMGAQYHYRNKLFWWSSGFEPGHESNLTVTGRRIDGDSPQANISRTTNAYAPSLGGWAMLVAAEFPGPGCWEITGRYLGQELKFTVAIPAAE
jgi:hypothetical protein